MNQGTDPSRIIRAVALFVAGVVVAVGSALVYSTAREMQQSPGVAQQKAEPKPLSSEVSKPGDGEADEAMHAHAQRGGPEQNEPVAAVTGSEPKTKTESATSLPIAKAPVNRSPAAAGMTRIPTITTSTRASDTAALPMRDAETSPATQPLARGEQQAAAVQGPHVVTLEPGSELRIRLSDTVSTDRDIAGQRFRASLETPIIVNGFIIAGRGSAVMGRVFYARRGGLFGKRPELSLVVNGINTTDGQFVSVQTPQVEEKGKRPGLTHAAKRAFSDVVNLASDAGKVAGFRSGDSEPNADHTPSRSGRDLAFERGSTLTFRLSRPVTITERTR